MLWANFLHFYQPPTQKAFWVIKIANESYRVLVRRFKENPKARATININAGLTELFIEHGCEDVVAGLRELAERGQIEFTASAKYHPFLPLMPEEEIRRQIELNTETNKKYFGDAYSPKGFFPPEMGYNRTVADVVHNMGFKWLIIDELAMSGKMDELKGDTVYTLKGAEDFSIFFRDRNTSFRILSAEVGVSIFSKGQLLALLGDRVNTNEYMITAMDGETFGHHRPGLDDLLFELYEAKELESVTISEINDRITKRKPVDPRPSSWALMKKDLERDTPYSRWNDSENEIHQMQWELTEMAIAAVHNLSPDDAGFPKIRMALDRSLHSDQYWWASASPWWSIEMMEAGAKELKDVVYASPASTEKQRMRALELYQGIVFTAFEWQRAGKVDEMVKDADEDVTQRITKELPHIPKEEFDSMVKNLDRQMLTAAKNKEYERAAQLRDRISELEGKREEITGIKT
ncbi:MAG: UvrB/UvrC motif-containing protein [Patescibacteria group bacterium]|jgi:hypothetical protein